MNCQYWNIKFWDSTIKSFKIFIFILLCIKYTLHIYIYKQFLWVMRQLKFKKKLNMQL